MEDYVQRFEYGDRTFITDTEWKLLFKGFSRMQLTGEEEFNRWVMDNRNSLLSLSICNAIRTFRYVQASFIKDLFERLIKLGEITTYDASECIKLAPKALSIKIDEIPTDYTEADSAGLIIPQEKIRCIFSNSTDISNLRMVVMCYVFTDEIRKVQTLRLSDTFIMDEKYINFIQALTLIGHTETILKELAADTLYNKNLTLNPSAIERVADAVFETNDTIKALIESVNGAAYYIYLMTKSY